MKKAVAILSFTLLGIPALSVSASAAAITCPASIDANLGQDRSYTVANATACVYGNGNITGNSDPLGQDDEFVFGPNAGFVGSDFTGGWTGLGETNGDGIGVNGLSFTFDSENSGGWTLDLSAYPDFTEFALGIVDGGTPKWAVFLLDLSFAVNGILTGTWDIDGLSGNGRFNENAGGFSHGTLYARGSAEEEEEGGAEEEGGTVPEPASMLLLAAGMAVTAARMRQRKANR